METPQNWTYNKSAPKKTSSCCMWEKFMQRFTQTGPASTDRQYRVQYTYTWFVSLNPNGRCKFQFKCNRIVG